jgi:hypothetical protein
MIGPAKPTWAARPPITPSPFLASAFGHAIFLGLLRPCRPPGFVGQAWAARLLLLIYYSLYFLSLVIHSGLELAPVIDVVIDLIRTVRWGIYLLSLLSYHVS